MKSRTLRNWVGTPPETDTLGRGEEGVGDALLLALNDVIDDPLTLIR